MRASARVTDGLEFGDGKIKGNFFEKFWIVGLKISEIFLCCRGDIVKILCSIWRHPWECRMFF